MHLYHILHCLQWSNSSCTVPISDLVPDLCSRGSDTWDTCDMHYLDYMILLDWPCDFNLWSHVLVIFWLCYTIVTRPRHLMFIIFMSQHACAVLLYIIYRLDYSCYCYFQFSILPNILFFLFQCPTCTVTAFLYFLFYCSFPFVYSYWSGSDGPLLFFSI